MDDLFRKFSGKPRRLIELVSSVGGTDAPYLPWDKLRHKAPPDGLSHDEWWFAAKLNRNANRRSLPFHDVNGNPFGYSLPDEVLEHCDEISRHASGQIAISEQVTNPATRDRYVVSSLIEEAITSSQLEGASTSRQVAKEMIRSGRPPKDRSERMILNNYYAMRYVVGVKDEPLSPALVYDLHRIVTEGTLDDPAHAGQLQKEQSERVGVYGDPDRQQVLHIPPPVEQLPTRLDTLCRFANDLNGKPWMHPVLRALTIHFMVGYDHYFEDGNGRTARALFYWSMLRHGYWLTEFLTISRILKAAPSQYARSFLLTEQDDRDMTYFFIYHLGIIRRAINALDEYLARKVKELQDTRLLLSSTPGEYNHRQLAALELAMKDESAWFTAQSHALSHNVSQETARQDLTDLEHRGLLRRTKSGKQYLWQPLPDLTDRVRSSRR